MENRHVGFLTIFKLLQNKKPHFFMGMLFTGMSIIFIVFFFFISRGWVEPYESYDHEVIMSKGIEQDAIIVSLNSKDNVNINGKNPLVITYSFKDKGLDKVDKFQTLDIEKATLLSVGDKVRIKIYNNESLVLGYEPFEFPVMLMLLTGPFMFFIGGIVMLLISVIPAFRIVSLYKKGAVREAEVYSITPVSGMPVTNIGRKVSIDYTYAVGNGDKQYGNTTTTDFYLLAEIKPGDKVKIFVSDNGKRSCLIPKKEAVKNNWNIKFD